MKNILFVTRKFQSNNGGMENFSKNFYKNISKEVNCDLLYNKNILILFFLFIFKNKNKYSNIHFGDGVLMPFNIFIINKNKIKTSVTLHGLDIIYNNFLYQFLFKLSIKKIDKIVCVSKFSYKKVLKRVKFKGKNRIFFISNGFERKHFSVKDFQNKDYLKNYKDKKIILFSVGRQIKRKGINWFLKNVFLHLSDDFVYFIAGIGPELTKIKSTIIKYNLKDRVFILGQISDFKLNYFYKNSDFFIMPNIKVKGDIEGFGITLIEAASLGSIPIASNIEGISSAIQNNENGHLIKEKNINGYISILNSYLKNEKLISLNSKKFQKYTIENFSWKVISKKYLNEVFD